MRVQWLILSVCITLQYCTAYKLEQRIALISEDMRIDSTPFKQSEEASSLQCTHKCTREKKCNSFAVKLKESVGKVLCLLHNLVITNLHLGDAVFVAEKGWILYGKIPPEVDNTAAPKCNRSVTCNTKWECCLTPGQCALKHPSSNKCLKQGSPNGRLEFFTNCSQKFMQSARGNLQDVVNGKCLKSTGDDNYSDLNLFPGCGDDIRAFHFEATTKNIKIRKINDCVVPFHALLQFDEGYRAIRHSGCGDQKVRRFCLE
eukprot:Seg3970.1 transcript_id=Seg3970.1/GoldUCD/mRNA.D3Y31 product="hypothetical protein" protein_id=Seg3970.1/GoldUCD/D3Y31